MRRLSRELHVTAHALAPNPQFPSISDDALRPPEWTVDASCTHVDWELWFPERGKAGVKATTAAKRICHTCPVQAECLNYADSQRPQHGIWGGHSREELRDRWRQAA